MTATSRGATDPRDVLAIITRWQRIQLRGGAVVLREPNTGAALCIRSGPRPLRAFDAVVEQLARAAGLASVEAVTSHRRLVTDEGEHAVLQLFRARRGTRTQPWCVAVVAADDAYTIIDGTALTPEIASIVERVACATCMGRSLLRARWPQYTPPRGWLGLRRSLATCWLPPGAPRDRALLIVGDAVPVADPVERTQSLVWFERPVLVSLREQLVLDGFSGELFQGRCGEHEFARAVITDDRFLYRFELQHPTADHVAMLREVIASLDAVPCANGLGGHADAEAFAWLD